MSELEEALIIVINKNDILEYEWRGPENGRVAVNTEYENSPELQDVIKKYDLVKLCDEPLKHLVWYVRKDRLMI